MPSSNSIFISYRRSDSNDVTGRIYDRLQQHFGPDVVFKDVQSIPYGDDFRTHLVQTVSQCRVVVAVLGPTWITTLQERLAREDQQDWVRAEIETALNREIGIPVIPLLVGGAGMPSREDLPEGLQSLVDRNAAQARPDPDFHVDLDRLIKRLEEIVGTPEPGTQTHGASDLSAPVTNSATSLEPSKQSSQSQSIGSITISGSSNSFNAIQSTGDVTVTQTQAKNPVSDPGLQRVLEMLKELKQAIAAAGAIDDTEKEMVAIPIKKLESELQKPQPDRKVLDRAIATITKVLDGVSPLIELVTKVAALLANI